MIINSIMRLNPTNIAAMKKISIFVKTNLVERFSIDVGVFVVFFLVTVLFVFSIVRSF